ncbi:unnamed protein product [Prorocentrum cordatum]|uniref:Uncharacterized protein n=1 Tax=Prorocentrum cordatum TaxID=2364126 RepID=A0ABN9S3D8_9DINO|nr:unnamed protein product [Polarella glacialis]
MRGKRGGDGGGEAGRDSRGRARRPGAAEAPGPPAAAPLRRAGRDGGASRPGAETGAFEKAARERRERADCGPRPGALPPAQGPRPAGASHCVAFVAFVPEVVPLVLL